MLVHFGAWAELVRQLREGFKTMAVAFKRVAEMFHSSADLLAMRRAQLGGEAQFAYSEEYLTTMCGAWLHEQCPSDAYDLRCTCRCHERREG